jgi:glycosyltransferase involved in cell wall biosynthesis
MADYTIVTDAWEPQINGVVTTYKNTIRFIDADVVYGSECFKVPLPGYPEITVALNPWKIASRLKGKVHIATEGPLGLFARLFYRGSYTTSYHTKFPEFIQSRTGIPASWIYPYFRWFHKNSSAVLVPTHGMKALLESKGFKNLRVWSRGVDHTKFHPSSERSGYIVCVSRVSVEKNLEAFCSIPGYKKILVGSGPQLEALRAAYPDVEFVGSKTGEELRKYYAEADCFVFPSYEDTFGVVLLEAIACGTPIASVPCFGSDEIVEEGVNGYVNEDLSVAVRGAISLNRDSVYASSFKWTWERATNTFLGRL